MHECCPSSSCEKNYPKQVPGVPKEQRDRLCSNLEIEKPLFQHVGIFEDLAAIPDCAHHVAGPVVDFVLPAVLKLNSVARLPLPRDI